MASSAAGLKKAHCGPSVAARNPLDDGVRLCKRGDVVVVTVNHRLNRFGYLSLAQLGMPVLPAPAWQRVVMAIPCNNVVHEHGPASVPAKPADSAHRQLLSLRAWRAIAQPQHGDAGQQTEAAWAGTALINAQHPSTRVHQRLVRMTTDDDVRLHLRRQCFQIVQHMDAHAIDLHIQRLW